MAVLKKTADQRWYCPGPRNLIGRAPTMALPLDHRMVSGEHASLTWTDGLWHIRDIGSRNGTTVDGVRLEVGKAHALSAGSVICFGDDAMAWTLIDAGPPGPVAVSGDAILSMQDGMLAVPSEDEPSAVVFEDHEGRWVLEAEGTPDVLERTLQCDIEGTTWTFLVPPMTSAALQTTWERACPMSLTAVALVLRVSLDEEHIEATATTPRGPVELGARSHHQLTLYLARARARDLDQGVSPAEAGWAYADDVAKALAITRAQVNQFTFRVRRELSRAGVDGAAMMIERRSSTGQLRLGSVDVEIRGF